MTQTPQILEVGTFDWLQLLDYESLEFDQCREEVHLTRKEIDSTEYNACKIAPKIKPRIFQGKLRFPRRKLSPGFVGTRWSKPEEIILLGVVTDCSRVFSSQASWPFMHRVYKLAMKRFNKAHKADFPTRTSCACQKHWKAMQRRVQTGEVARDYWYNLYNKLWFSVNYNKGNTLVNVFELTN